MKHCNAAISISMKRQQKMMFKNKETMEEPSLHLL